MSLGLDFIASVMKLGEIDRFLALRPTDELFNAYEKEIFIALMGHVSKYGALPSVKALQRSVRVEINLPEVEDPPEYIFDLLRERYVSESVYQSMMDAKYVLEKREINCGTDAYWKLFESLSKIGRTADRVTSVDIRQQKDEYVALYKERFHLVSGAYPPGVMFGWLSMDSNSIGLRKGDVVSYVGRPGVGKTWSLLFTAHHAWRYQNKSVGVVTFEMDPEVIMDRVVALDARISPTYLMGAGLSTPEIKRMQNTLIAFSEHETPFYIIDGGFTSTVSDLLQVVKRNMVDILFIDGAYMLQHSDTRLNRFNRTGENVILIKNEIAKGLGIPVVCSYQFSRSASNKLRKGNSKVPIDYRNVGLEDIGYSDAIGEYSTVVLAMFEPETVETLVSRKMLVLKNRNAPVTTFTINWDLDKMNFEELEETEDPLDHV